MHPKPFALYRTPWWTKHVRHRSQELLLVRDCAKFIWPRINRHDSTISGSLLRKTLKLWQFHATRTLKYAVLCFYKSLPETAKRNQYIMITTGRFSKRTPTICCAQRSSVSSPQCSYSLRSTKAEKRLPRLHLDSARTISEHWLPNLVALGFTQHARLNQQIMFVHITATSGETEMTSKICLQRDLQSFVECVSIRSTISWFIIREPKMCL